MSSLSTLFPSPFQPPSCPTIEDRKKDIRRANFFAECHLRGIDFQHACSAMDEAMTQQDKWWVQTSACKPPSAKKRRIECDNQQNDPSNGRKPDCGSTTRLRIDEPVRTIMDPDEPAFEIKENLIRKLLSTTDTSAEKIPNVQELVNQLSVKFKEQQRSTSALLPSVAATPCEGLWLTISKPTYAGCLGRSENGHWSYGLGRLSFDRFRPDKLTCSIEHVVNNVSDEYTTKEQGRVVRRRRYDIVSSFVVEPQELSKELKIERPIHGLLTTQGQCEDDPEVPNRLTVSFTGGLLELQDPQDLSVWKQIFEPDGTDDNTSQQTVSALIAEKFLLGAESQPMESDGTIRYDMKRPIGGQHGQVFVDVLYQDHSLRILQGHRGTLYISIRVPEEDEDEEDDGICVVANEKTLIQIG